MKNILRLFSFFRLLILIKTFPLENELEDDIFKRSNVPSSSLDEENLQLIKNWNPGQWPNPDEISGYFQGDIVFKKPRGFGNSLIKQSSFWPNATVPYAFDSRVTQNDRNVVKKCISEFQSKTCVKFVERKYDKHYAGDYVFISSDKSGCYSHVGRVGGKQDLNLQSPGCNYYGIACHELMHALGFDHEHNRHDRDEFVRIVRSNVEPGKFV